MLVIFFTMALFTVSCDLWEWEEEEEEIYPQKKEEVAPAIEEGDEVYEEVIMNEQAVTSSAPLGELEPGDVLDVFFFANRVNNLFDENEVSYPSRWKVKRCASRFFGICLKRKWYSQKGSCSLRYRKEIGAEEGDRLILDENLQKVPLSIKIGKEAHPLGEMIDYSPDQIFARFTVTEEMIKDRQDAFIKVSPRKNNRSTKVGFLGYGRCDGKGRRGFRQEGPTSSHRAPSERAPVFFVTVELTRVIKQGPVGPNEEI